MCYVCIFLECGFSNTVSLSLTLHFLPWLKLYSVRCVLVFSIMGSLATLIKPFLLATTAISNSCHRPKHTNHFSLFSATKQDTKCRRSRWEFELGPGPNSLAVLHKQTPRRTTNEQPKSCQGCRSVLAKIAVANCG